MDFNQFKILDLLKSGARQFQGINEVTLKCIEAVAKLSQISRTSIGPQGLNKMVINHLQKIFVSKHTTTISQNLEIVHPAAKMVAEASQSQEEEVGDGTNFVMTFAGELLIGARELYRLGLSTSDIIRGYKRAQEIAQKLLKEEICDEVTDIRDQKQIEKALYSVISAKQYGLEDIIVPLVSKASILACPKKPEHFNVDNVRVLKVEGSSTDQSFIVNGFAIRKDSKGTIKHVKNAKVAVFSCNVDESGTETKFNIVLKDVTQLKEYSKSEEKAIEKTIKEIAESGVNVIVTQGSFGEMALHFIERYKMMPLKINSKHQIRRLCRSIGASIIVRLGAPTKEEIGECKSVDIKEVGGKKICFFEKEASEKVGLTTVVVRGSTKNVMDEIERTINDGVNAYKCLIENTKLVAGAGAVELEIHNKLIDIAEKTPGLDQYALKQYAESFLAIPASLSETSGLNPTNVLSKLTGAHSEGKKHWGVDIEGEEGLDAKKEKIFDSYFTKSMGIKLATNVSTNILNIDQIIMARPAGGPKFKKPQ